MQKSDVGFLFEQGEFRGLDGYVFGDTALFPLQAIAFGRLGAAGREALVGQFGLVPSWVDDARGGAKFGRHCYNARVETVFEKPSFREAIRHRRAVLPVSAFYEFPDREVPLRRRLKVQREDGQPFWLAAIWENHASYKLDSVAILTTSPMELIAPFHSRSPVFLGESQLDAWLYPDLQKPAELEMFLRPAASKNFVLIEEPWGKPDPNLDLFQ